MADPGSTRLTAYSHGAGCACKLGPDDLAQVLGALVPPSHPDLLVGRDTGDDAAVWRRPDGNAIMATVDVFTPIVDDAETWGRIAATNAASDVYAMGGTPLFAVAFAAWPREQLPFSLLTDVLAGGQAAANEGGWLVAGGHTIDGPEPLYGQTVIGEVDETAILTHAAARPGDALVLTKPIGTGLVTTAVKRAQPSALAAGGDLHDLYRAAVDSMTRRNDIAARLAREVGAHAGTDVTGFGVLGHVREMAAASQVDVTLAVAAVPRLPSVESLIDAGAIAGGTRRNLDHARPYLDVDAEVAESDLILLADAQTSGGLLLSLPAETADGAVRQLRADGHDAAVIGAVSAASDSPRIRVSRDLEAG